MSENTEVEKMELAVNDAMAELRALNLRGNMMNTEGGLDQKRPKAWREYGWPNDVTFQDFRRAFRRTGIAHGAVKKLINKCWSRNPQITDGDVADKNKKETAWEKKLKPFLARDKVWRAFKEADMRRLVGGYSALLIQVRQSGTWSWKDPIKGKVELVKLIPVWRNAIKVLEREKDPTKENFNEPISYSYTPADQENKVAGEDTEIHADRVFILGDIDCDEVPFLEPAYNSLINLEKIEGGSGESFLKNAARQLSVSFDKEIDLSSIAAMHGVALPELKEKFNEAARKVNTGTDMLLINQGATVTPLVANVPDPTPPYMINVQTVAAAWEIPMKILIGMQTGERASTEDAKEFADRCQSRCVSELAHDLYAFFDQMIRVGLVAKVKEYTVVWDELTESTPTEKAATAKVMADINAANMATGEETFTKNEVREAAGYEPVDGGDELGEKEEEEELPPLPTDEEVEANPGPSNTPPEQ